MIESWVAEDQEKNISFTATCTCMLSEHSVHGIISDSSSLAFSFSLPVDEVFSELSPEPLGAASLAQCHRGVLRDGEKVVAVKIQHPDVHTNAYTDLETIQVRMIVCVAGVVYT